MNYNFICSDHKYDFYFSEHLLLQLAYNKQLNKQPKLTACPALKGKKYNNELMIIGRAVNGWQVTGWDEGISIRDLQKYHAEFTKSAFLESEDERKCPLAWISEQWGYNDGETYNTKKSSFWRVTHSLVEYLNIANSDIDNWASYILWSNLCKVAPLNGGNPSDTLYYAQESACIELLKIELVMYQPKLIVFITDIDWASPFVKAISNDYETVKNSTVKVIGKSQSKLGASRFIVATRPEGKNEYNWVSEVLKNLDFI